MKLYERDFAQIAYRRELFNGLFLRSSLEYAHRRPLFNTTNYAWANKDRDYSPNQINTLNDVSTQFPSHEALLLDVALRIRFKQQYLSYPNRKYVLGSEFPDIWIRYRKAFAVNNGFADFDRLSMSVRDDWQLGLVGNFSLFLSGGIFLNDNRVFAPDFAHFNGNRVHIGDPERYYNSFLALPYYIYSTTDAYFQAHAEHNFQGFLLDKIPGIRKLGWKTVLRASALKTENNDWYWEVAGGLDNIGFNFLRLLRVDVVSSFIGNDYQETRVVVGIKL